jgi:hypothetical protein
MCPTVKLDGWLRATADACRSGQRRLRAPAAAESEPAAVESEPGAAGEPAPGSQRRASWPQVVRSLISSGPEGRSGASAGWGTPWV